DPSPISPHSCAMGKGMIPQLTPLLLLSLALLWGKGWVLRVRYSVFMARNYFTLNYECRLTNKDLGR
ncbi:hypothetical protein K8T06_10140, partial [bacterium]|nr:hypothetical protein [bacterium]